MKTQQEVEMSLPGHHLTNRALEAPVACVVCGAHTLAMLECSHCSFKEALCDEHWPAGGG